jgi:hypothetical protein
MRLLLIVVCFILTACASTSKSDNYIRSTGVGNTYEEAKNNAFREAIEYQVGVVIASERETYNEKLIKNEILAYSSAFVDEYKIISQQNIGNKVQVIVDVKLSLLRISDRIMSKGKDNKYLDGAKHDNQYKSFMENKQNGDKIISSVLNDYPSRAFLIKQNKYIIKIDSNRNLTLSVPYTMEWNPNYIASFHDVTKVVADGKLSFLEKSGIGQKYPGAVTIENDSYYFSDNVIPLKIVYGMLAGNEPTINIKLKDSSNQSHYSKCFTPSVTYDNFRGPPGTAYLVIKPKASESGTLSINIHRDSRLANVMKNLFTIELSVIPKKLCPSTE